MAVSSYEDALSGIPEAISVHVALPAVDR